MSVRMFACTKTEIKMMKSAVILILVILEPAA